MTSNGRERIGLTSDAPSGSGAVAPRLALDIRDLSVVYRTPLGDVRAVDGVSLALRAGEVVGLAGESGSGKSTLAYGACRLLRAPALITSGSVIYQGRRAAEAVEILNLRREELRRLRWREIAIVFQSAMNALNPVLNVRDQLLDVIRAHLTLSRDEAAEKVGSLLDLVGIPRSRLRSYPHELSGGMRQRVMIAMALATDPEVVIMDEPTTALDVVVQRDIIAQIVELKEHLGFSILFITHDLSLLLELADRIAVMYAGQLVEIATADDIHHGAAHPYTKGLLNSFPSLRGPRRELAGIPGVPPDLYRPPPGCRFLPRCSYGTKACTGIDMKLAPVVTSSTLEHLTACPFVLPDTPVPKKPRSGGALENPGLSEADDFSHQAGPAIRVTSDPTSGEGSVAAGQLYIGPEGFDGEEMADVKGEPSPGRLGT